MAAMVLTLQNSSDRNEAYPIFGLEKRMSQIMAIDSGISSPPFITSLGILTPLFYLSISLENSRRC